MVSISRAVAEALELHREVILHVSYWENFMTTNSPNPVPEIGYFRYATISSESIVFACEDDLWSITASGGTAHRLTTGHGEFATPKLSPDGKRVAFVGREEGHPEVYVIPIEGGLPKRLTYLGGETCYVSGWSSDGKEILFTSDAKAPFVRHSEAFSVSCEGGLPRPLQLGHVQSISVQYPSVAGASKTAGLGPTVIGRNANDPARWKRYRGGTAGEIWIDASGNGEFRKLIDLPGNLVLPMWLDKRVYFLSDHDGFGNIYSCNLDGGDLTQHTTHNDYYVRFPSTDGKRISYTSGGALYVFDAATNTSKKVDAKAAPTTIQSVRKFVSAAEYLEHIAPHPQGHSVAVIARGQPITMANWEGAVIQHGRGSRSRYRNCEWLADGQRFVVISDSAGFEQLELHHADQSVEPIVACKGDIGRVIDIRVSPKEDLVAIANHRHELILVDLKTKSFKLIDKSPADRINGISWSADGRWLAYSWAPQPQSFIIRIAEAKTLKVHDVTSLLKFDYEPCFDPEGRYLYFLSARDFYPVYDTLQFDLRFPQSVRPFLVTLRKDVRSPFEQLTDAEKKKAEAEKSDAEKSDADKTKKVEIDFEGIEKRIVGFPVEEGRYGQVVATANRVYFSEFPVKGIRPNFNWLEEEPEPGALSAYDFNEHRTARICFFVNHIRISNDCKAIYYASRKRIRAIDSNDGFPAEGVEPWIPPETPGRKSRVLDLHRAQILVEPQEEWKQMYAEAWRLQSEHFWDSTMSDVDWNLVHDRYAVLLSKIRTRSELSDVIWEMQGELGTSHAYEIGGDYRRQPNYQKGFLGADLALDTKTGGYAIKRILRGDSWDAESDSPLAAPGLDVKMDDVIVAVGGRSVNKDCTLDELLINGAGKTINLTIMRKNKKHNVAVCTLKSERTLRYREWVENNRQIVHEKSDGRLGYLHIPDMGPAGFAEFHRGYLAELSRDGMIVDVRYNRGGHVSALLLEKLARKRVGYDVSRWGPPQPYPTESIAGPMVAITNQFAGSDGDIFSHCFKLYKLGPLVGKRTWGGVIGIWPRHRLVDGTVTTQPEFSFWFSDVGFRVENYGTDPDYEVDIAPQDYKNGRDPQMDKALSLALEALKKSPVALPDFTVRPRLPLPTKR
jgi:tricorn protease